MTSRDTYHHGDLRRAVLTAALDVIRTEGPAALSLRDLARRAGVSHAAPAHHFKDRTGLLTAIATEGYDLLTAALSDATDLRDAGVRYVRFAVAHPAHFQVMFQPDLQRAEDPELQAAKARSYERLRAKVAGLTGDRVGDPELTGTAAWSIAHGFATLLLTNNLDRSLGGRSPEDAFWAVADAMFGNGGGE
ncbi:TetR/AcrR family transcriptional regulator [Streptomyces chryseus]